MPRKLLYFKFVLSVLLITSLSSCVNFNVDSSYKLDPGKPTGLLIMSYTHTTDSVTLYYRNVETELEDAIMTNTFRDPFDWYDPKGRLVVIEVPVGKYEFIKWESGRGNYRYTSKPFTIPFEIKRGKAVYIGGVHISIDEIFGYYTLKLSDQRKRDLEVLNDRFTHIKESDIVFNVPENIYNW